MLFIFICSEHSFEIPPPLPPRRRLKHSNTNPDLDEIKQKRSAWNIIDNVFGRNKKSGTLTRSPTTASATGINHSTRLRTQFDTLCNKQNSFSTPDLTNIAEAVTSNYNIIDIDDNDLEIMDIERSNSLNSAANQFLCRPPTLNISSNILWSHNLSSNLSAMGDSSAVNLVGANINTEQFLNDELSDYCKMVSTPHSWNEDSFNVSKPLSATNSNGFDLSSNGCRVIEDLSGYCHMAPIFNQKDNSKKTPDHQLKNKIIAQDIVVAGKRASYHDDESSSLLDFSLVSNDKHSSRGSCHDEYSSSGVSSDEGAIYAQNLRTAALEKVKSKLTLDIEHDDAISITCTESPTSPMAISPAEFVLSKQKISFDEKYPSYYPNANIYSSPIDIKKPASNNGTRTLKSPLHNLNMSCCPNSRKTPTVKTFTKNPMKKQSNRKTKPDDNSIHRERMGNEENSPLANDAIKMQKLKSKTKTTMRGATNYPHILTAGGEKISTDHKSTAHKFRSKTKASVEMEMATMRTPLKPDEVKGISTLPHTKSSSGKKYNNFGTLPKTPATPKHIYRKCASFANRITSPSTPSHSSSSPSSTSSSSNDAYPTSPLSTPGQETRDIGMDYKYTTESVHQQHANGSSKGSDITGSILRFATLTRFRKIDFSPLKVKFTNILQRQNSEI